MAKASPALGELISAAETPRPPVCTPTSIQNVMDKMRREAAARGLKSPWLTIVTATTMSIGTPKTIAEVAQHMIATVPPSEVTEAIEFVREVGMSCVVMNGVQSLYHWSYISADLHGRSHEQR